MYAMRDSDRRLLDRYKALGTPEEIEAKLRSPYPAPNSGYAPLPLADDDDFSLGGGLLEDEGPPIVDDPWADK